MLMVKKTVSNDYLECLIQRQPLIRSQVLQVLYMYPTSSILRKHMYVTYEI